MVVSDSRSSIAGRRLVTVVVLVCVATLPGAAQSRPARPASQATSRDEVLWTEIQAADRALADTQPYSPDREAALRPRRRLLELTRVYLTSYPGGPRRDEVVRLELKALFEIGTLAGGEFDPLRARVAECLAHPPSEAVLHEAAYWQIRCDRLARVATATQPSSAPVMRRDEELLAAYRGYIERYPRSRHVPRMVNELFDAAVANGDLAEQHRLLELLERGFREHAVTRLLAAQLARQEAIGRPFSLSFEAADGAGVDTARWRGRPVLIVVWAGFCERCRALVPEIEAFRVEHPALRVVGVNLDESEQKMAAACRELGVNWPQFNDGMSWANRLARRWGVRTVPLIFALDREGRLAGFGDEEAWCELAESVLDN